MGKRMHGNATRSKFKRNRRRTTVLKENIQDKDQPFSEATTERIKEQGYDPGRVSALGRCADRMLVDLISKHHTNPAEALMVAGNIVLSVVSRQAPSRASALITVVEMLEGYMFAIDDMHFDEQGSLDNIDSTTMNVIAIMQEEIAKQKKEGNGIDGNN